MDKKKKSLNTPKKTIFIEKSPENKCKNIPVLNLENLNKFFVLKLRFVNRKEIALEILNYFNINNGAETLSEKFVINLCQNFGSG
jgi:hypothetical protein